MHEQKLENLHLLDKIKSVNPKTGVAGKQAVKIDDSAFKRMLKESLVNKPVGEKQKLTLRSGKAPQPLVHHTNMI